MPQAQVTGSFDISLNAVAVRLNGAALEKIAAAPMVKSAQYEGVYVPNVADPDMRGTLLAGTRVVATAHGVWKILG